jgi:phosphoribosyl 1,2-cyclic phosphodiesterase
MRVKFWGVRGSYPVPGVATNRYGGNTCCVQIRPDNDAVIIIDAGTGIRRLGKELMAGRFKQGEGVCHLLISHTHWDHIQGLPFFSPLYVAGNQIHVYARQRDVHLKTLFCSQTEDPYFPVSLDEVAAQVTYTELPDNARFLVEGVKVSSARLNHPFISIGYRLDVDGASVAYVSDTAPFSNILLEHDYIPTSPDLGKPVSSPDLDKLVSMRNDVIELCRRCDLVIFDTMFRMEEYLARPHWGHSTPEHALEIAEEAGASHLALFHYSPLRKDDEVDRDLEQARRKAKIHVLAAREGMELLLDGGRVEELR